MGALEDLIASHLGEFSAAGGVHLPGTPGYDACLFAACGANYACLHERRAPPLALQPACERDVVLAVLAVAEGRRRGLWPAPGAPPGAPVLTVCGGGHSELCVVHGAVLLHMRRMRDVRVVGAGGPDPAVEIGPGALLGELGERAAAHGLAVPTGVFAGVGVGSVLMGGVGRLARRRGLSVQSILELDVVAADGSVHRLKPTTKSTTTSAPTPSDSEDEKERSLARQKRLREMWWACRGACPAFGVATRVKLRAFPAAGPVAHGRRLHGPNLAVSAAADRLAATERVARRLPEWQQIDVCVARGRRADEGGRAEEEGGEDGANRTGDGAPRGEGASAPRGEGAGGVAVGVFPCALEGGGFDPADAAEAGFHASDLREARYVDVPYHSMLPEAEEDAASGRAASREFSSESKAESESSPGGLGGVPSQATPGMFSYVRQWFVDELGASGAALVARLAAEAPTDECLLMLQHAGGAARRGGQGGPPETGEERGHTAEGGGGKKDAFGRGDACAFAPKEWETSLVIIALWTDPGAEARAEAERWADGAHEALRPFGRGVYAVDVDPFRRPGAAAEEELELAFGEEGLERLRALKAEVDPEGLFRATLPL